MTARTRRIVRSDYRAQRGMSELPGPLRLTSSFPFVGRSAELERLRTLMPSADGEGSARGAARRRAGLRQEPPRPRVRRGGRGGRHAGALRGMRRRGAHAVRRVRGGARAGRPRRSSPRSCAWPRGPAPPTSPACCPSSVAHGRPPPAAEADPDTERHRLHTAVADLLAAVTRERPALLVLEDVHWADAPTLLLLRHLARAGVARILLLATFRDTEAEMPDAVTELLADLRRYDVVEDGRGRALRRGGGRVRPARPAERRPEPPSSRRRSASSPTATRSSSASSGGR